MEVLYSAKRINNDTSLRWFVYDDDQYSGYAVTNDGQRIEVDYSNLQSFYINPTDIEFSNKSTQTTTSTKNGKNAKAAKTSKKEPIEKKSQNSNVVAKKQKASAPKVVIPEESTVVVPAYNKSIYAIKGKHIDMEVDGSIDDANSMLNELKKRHQDVTLIKKTIRTIKEVVDRYTLVEHYRDGQLVFEMDFDDVSYAVTAFEKRKNQYPDDDVRMHHVEEVIEKI